MGEDPVGSGVGPLVRGRGANPSTKLKHFWFLDVQQEPQICPLFQNLKMQRNETFVLTLQKIMDGHKTGGPGVKLESTTPLAWVQNRHSALAANDYALRN